ncbi:MAG: hypothetical protein M5U14_01805 [Acidimicrobiia bacterium]|nr:hypothetical protein [Acidimicrobiia bacterium]
MAQAFHWFDAPAALAELRRVLVPGGRLGLVWNVRDRGVEWVDRVWSVMDRVERRAPWRDHDHGPGAGFTGAEGFGPVHRATFHHEQRTDPAGVVERIRSVSHVAVLPAAEQDAVVREVEGLLATHPDTRGRAELLVPYRVDAFWCERA